MTEKKVALTAEQLKNIGYELLNIVNNIKMHNLALEGLEYSKNDHPVFLWNSKKYISTALEQNQGITKKLDDMAFLLLENDNQRELESISGKG